MTQITLIAAQHLAQATGTLSIAHGIATFEDGTTIDLKRLAAQQWAFDALLKGLEDLGFGSDEPINGADAVDAIAELYDDVTGRILAGGSEDDESGTEQAKAALQLPPVTLER